MIFAGKSNSLYPLKGMKGSINSNFYEFLTMGMVPYLIGSGMLIALFNAATKYFEPSQARFASKTGRGMALGVIFYGLMKNLSKKFIETPIYLKTGVDINMPYKDMKAQLPENPNMKNNKAKLIEHHKSLTISFEELHFFSFLHLKSQHLKTYVLKFYPSSTLHLLFRIVK